MTNESFGNMKFKKTFLFWEVFVIATLLFMIAISSSVLGASSTPEDGEKDVPIDTDIIIVFDVSMDTDTVEISFDPDPGVSITREWSNFNTTLKLTLSESLSHDKKYTVTIGGRSEVGDVVPYRFSFTTEPEPIVLFGFNIQEDLPLLGFSLWNLIMFIVVLIIGLIVVKIVGRSVRKSLLKGKASEILAEFTSRLIKIMLTIFVVFTALGFLGLDMGEYILGLAVVLGFVLGFAMGDTLSNIAAGFMVAITKPFKAGDVVTIGGETGAIQSVGISVTELNTPDNKRIIIPNKSVWGGNIINFTRHGKRRVDMEVGVGYTDDLNKVIKTTMEVIKSHPKILSDPAPQVAVSDHGDSAVGLVVRPWCLTDDYWDVFFDMKKALKEAYDREGISIPFPQR
ncbi:MAG: mechanosensitive ion channel, partial [Thermoplasmata archaeon]